MSDIHKGGHVREEINHSSKEVSGHVTELVMENGLENLKPNVKKRLELDLKYNQTADYSRINLTEVFVTFNCDAAQTVTHWRIAKILDGINFAARELKICDGIGPTEVEKKVYKPLLNGKANEATWPINIPDLEDPNKTTSRNISLSDFAYLLDIVNTNRNLGAAKLNLKDVVINFFYGKDLSFDRPEEIKAVKAENIRDEDVNSVQTKGKSKRDNLLNEQINPRDDYEGFEEDLKSYIKHIKGTDVQIGLQMMDSWRYTSSDHRELGGQAYAVNKSDGSGMWFIPLSGRMASEVTLSDLQKGEKGGMMGQPQEVGEMDEAQTGAVIRFRLADLAQRRKGGDVKNTNKTPRLSKAMLGMVLKEESADQIKTTINTETGGTKSSIYLCGERLDGQIIKGMKAHYDRTMVQTRGFGLTRYEAADLVFTDVFAPCIINNENDWLTALSSIYAIGGSRSSFSLVQNKEKFQDFELIMWCRDIDNEPDMPITKHTFKGMKELREYLSKRIQKGHIDQPGVERFASAAAIEANAKPDKGENDFCQDKIKNETQGKKIGELVRYVLGEYATAYLKKYIAKGSGSATFLTVYDKDGKFVPNGETFEGKTNVSFSVLIGQALCELRKRGDSRPAQLLEEVYDIDFQDPQYGEDMAEKGLQSTLEMLSDEERKKIV